LCRWRYHCLLDDMCSRAGSESINLGPALEMGITIHAAAVCVTLHAQQHQPVRTTSMYVCMYVCMYVYLIPASIEKHFSINAANASQNLALQQTTAKMSPRPNNNVMRIKKKEEHSRTKSDESLFKCTSVYVHFLLLPNFPLPKIRKPSKYDSFSPSLCAVLGIISYKKASTKKRKWAQKSPWKPGVRVAQAVIKPDRETRIVGGD